MWVLLFLQVLNPVNKTPNTKPIRFLMQYSLAAWGPGMGLEFRTSEGGVKGLGPLGLGERILRAQECQ